MESEARAELSAALGTVIHEVKMQANFERKLETCAALSFAGWSFHPPRATVAMLQPRWHFRFKWSNVSGRDKVPIFFKGSETHQP